MKRYVKCDDMSNSSREWLASEEVDALMKSFTSSEKRFVARLAQAKNPVAYLNGFIDAVELLDVDISGKFGYFLQKCTENIY